MASEKEKNNASGQMRKWVLEYIICLYLQKRDYYAWELIDEIKQSNLEIVEGTMYPLLSRMLKSEYLAYKWEESVSGHPRKYYCLTEKWQDMLKHMEQSWNSLEKAVKSAKK